MRITSQLPDLRHLAEKALSWIVYARRPLLPDELQHALAVEPGDADLDTDALTDIDDILSACAGLVILEAGSSNPTITTVRLVHYTTQEYFEGIGAKTLLSRAQLYVAKTCLTYLAMPCPARPRNEGPRGPIHDRVTLEKEFALLNYAGSYWCDHVRNKFEGDLQHLVAYLFEINSRGSNFAGRSFLDAGAAWPHLCVSFDLKETFQIRLRDEIFGNSNSNHTILESRTLHGSTPLIYAINEGNLEIVRLLITKAKVNVNARDNNGCTPLYCAMYGSDADIVRELLNSTDIDINAQDVKSSQTALMVAAQNNSTHKFEMLIARENIDLSIEDSHQRTILHHAGRGSTEIMKTLLNNPCITTIPGTIEIDSRDDNGRTPLSYTLEYRYHPLDVVKLFVERGAHVDSGDNAGRTPLSYSVSPHRILELSDNRHMTAADVNLEESRFLIDKGAGVNIKDNDGRTPLSWLAGSSPSCTASVEVAKLLLQSGADIDCEDSSGRTPLSWAAHSASSHMLDWLLKQGACVNSRDSAGRTPLCYVNYDKESWFAMCASLACGRLEPLATEVLLLAGANVELPDDEGRTALSYAAEAGAKVVVELLINHGACLDGKDEKGRTALSYAAEYSTTAYATPGLIELLIDRGACLEVEDNTGKTPLWYATRNKDTEVLRVLRTNTKGESNPTASNIQE